MNILNGFSRPNITMFGVKMTKKFLSFNLRCYLFGDFSIKYVKECSRKCYNKQRHNLNITLTSAIATTTKFEPLEGHLSGSRTSKDVPVRERKEQTICVISTKCQLAELKRL